MEWQLVANLFVTGRGVSTFRFPFFLFLLTIFFVVVLFCCWLTVICCWRFLFVCTVHVLWGCSHYCTGSVLGSAKTLPDVRRGLRKTCQQDKLADFFFYDRSCSQTVSAALELWAGVCLLFTAVPPTCHVVTQPNACLWPPANFRFGVFWPKYKPQRCVPPLLSSRAGTKRFPTPTACTHVNRSRWFCRPSFMNILNFGGGLLILGCNSGGGACRRPCIA